MQLNITLIIIIITALVSIGGFGNQKIIDDLIFYPPAITRRNQWYRFFSSGLIHADYAHLIFNMISLYLFGRFVEERFIYIFGDYSKIVYIAMYILALGVSLLPTFLKHKDNYHYRSLGASGAVSAVVFAGLLVAPNIEVYMPIPIPGFIYAPLYLGISIYMQRRGGDNINHSAHIWGALFGVVFVIVVGKLVADFDAITYCIGKIKDYLADHGWG